MIPLKESRTYLTKTVLQKVWGIGPNSAAYLNKYKLYTALDFALKDEAWVTSKLAKPLVELWRELNGEVALELDTEGRESYQSISKTKTFTPPSTDPEFIFSQLSKNVENACIKARRWNLATPEIFFFLKTQEFKYHGYEIKLPHPTSVPQDILKAIREFFPKVFKKGTRYRATGITLTKLQEDNPAQLDLFGAVLKSQGLKRVFDSVDQISERYGKHAVFLGSSFGAMTQKAHENARGDQAERVQNLFRGETARRRLAMPFMGEVT